MIMMNINVALDRIKHSRIITQTVIIRAQKDVGPIHEIEREEDNWHDSWHKLLNFACQPKI